MSLDRAIAECFALLEAVVPNFPEPSKKAKAMQVWRMVLEAERVTPPELKAALAEYLRTGKFMPAPSEVLECVRRANPCSLILDPVKTGEHMGVDEIGSRERCEALDKPFVELREPSVPELPGEVRETAIARLEQAERSFKRVPKARRERPALDESPDPDALERQRAMVEGLRRAEA